MYVSLPTYDPQSQAFESQFSHFKNGDNSIYWLLIIIKWENECFGALVLIMHLINIAWASMDGPRGCYV